MLNFSTINVCGTINCPWYRSHAYDKSYVSHRLAKELYSLSAYRSSVSHGVKISVCGLAVKKSHLGFKS